MRCRGVRSLSCLEAFLQDARFGLRQLARNRGVSLIILLSLALGLGATTAMFSLLNALLFKSLPVPEPDRLIVVTHGTGYDRGPSMSYPALAALREKSKTAADLTGLSSWQPQLSAGPVKRKIDLAIVSGNFYAVLGVRPQIGRLLVPADDRRNGSSRNAVVLSDRLWRRAFHSDPGIAGRKILLDGVPFIVAGVTPKGFFGVSPGGYKDATVTSAAIALLNPKSTLLDCANCNAVEVMGRLRPHVSLQQTEAALRVGWFAALQETNAADRLARFRERLAGDRLFLDPGGSGPDSYLRATFAKPLYLLLAMSVLILLAACSNVANLLLARAQARGRELAVRLSTGASRLRIVQQFLTESLLLTLLGLAAGALVYQGCVRGLLWFMQGIGWNVVLDTKPDPRMLGFTLALTGLTALLFGVAPAIRASRVPLRGSLAESSAQASRESKLGRGLLAMQLALASILLTGALLLAHSLYDLRTFDAGFRRDHLLLASTDGDLALTTPLAQLHFVQLLLPRIAALPGVRAASVSTLLPFGSSWQEDYTADGYLPQGKASTECYQNFVTPRFFETMGTPLLLGREFSSRDAAPGAPPVAIVSESFAHHFFGAANPIGQHIHDLDKTGRISVIGVVRDARQRNLRLSAPRTVYLPFPAPSIDGAIWSFQLEVWTTPHPDTLTSAVKNIFHEEDSRIPLEIQTFDQLIDKHLLYQRLLTAIAICFGAVGTLMAAIGVYGTAAYSTSRRTLEVGIRVALGATRMQIVRLFVTEHLRLTLVGLGGGIIGSLELTRFLQAWLFGVSPGDVFSFTVCFAVLGMVSALATLLPAVRAVRIEPWRALRRD